MFDVSNDAVRLRFENIILSNETIRAALDLLESMNLPDGWLTGGAIRCTVWNWLHGFELNKNIKDLDFVYFSKEIMSIEQNGKMLNGVLMEFENQAFIHEWYVKTYGIKFKPLDNVEDGLYLWSDSCGSILVRQLKNKLETKSLYGLSDLCGGIIRPIKERYEKYGLPISDYDKRLIKWDVENKYPKIKILHN